MSHSSSDLCAVCGLCCNGSFFAQVTLEAEELPRLRRRRLPMVAQGERHVLQLPCPLHTGSACSIYEDRPTVCAAYRCGILIDYHDGGISFEEATRKIEHMRSVARRIRTALDGTAQGEPLYAAAEAFFQSDGGLEWRKRHSDILLDMAVFLTSCRKDFGVRRKPAGDGRATGVPSNTGIADRE